MPIAELCRVKMLIAELCQVKMPITENKMHAQKCQETESVWQDPGSSRDGSTS